MIKLRFILSLLIVGLLFGILPLTAHAEGVVTDCSTYGDAGSGGLPLPGTLAAAIVGGGDVTFQCSGEITVPRIRIQTDTRIDANRHDVILSGDFKNTIFRVEVGVSLDLIGLKITKSYSSFSSGAIQNYGILHITDCAIYGNNDRGIDNNEGETNINRSSISYNERQGVQNIMGIININNSVISDNSHNGIRNSGGSVTIENSIISQNTAMSGAGISNINWENNVGEMTLNNTEVSNNHAYSQSSNASAAGIYNSGDMIITDSIITGNRSTTVTGNSHSGGIYNHLYGTMVLVNSVISDNLANSTGGISNQGNMTLLDSYVLRNISENGNAGGIYNFSGSTTYSTVLTIIGSKISHNTASERGGGIHSYGGTLTIDNSTISDNYSGFIGGGINSVVNSILTIKNSTISNNTTVERGGGIYNFNNNEAAKIINSTISGNTASEGGGIRNAAPLILEHVTLYGNSATKGSNLFVNNTIHSTVQISNSLIAGGLESLNCADYGTKYITDHGYNLDDDGTCNLTDLTSLPDAYAGIAPELADNGGFTQTHALLTSSPAIDWIPTGISGCGDIIVSDQRGVYRPQGLGCDIGSYELIVVVDDKAPVVTDIHVYPNPSPADSEVTLTATIDDTLTGNSNILSADYSLNGGDWTPMIPDDLVFDSPIEDVFAKIFFTDSDYGRHTICVRGADAFNNISVPACTELTIEPGIKSVHVHGINGSIKGNKKSFQLTVTVEILDNNYIPVQGVVVHAQITNPADGGSVRNVKARTNRSGVASFKTNSSIPSWKFCVTDLVKTGYSYDSASNNQTCATFAPLLPTED